jgi:hypothetical protein
VSADVWRVCPRCKQKAEAAIEAAEMAAAQSYGEVPANEWKLMVQKVAEMRRGFDSPDETFREDYELGMDPDGEFSVGYHGQCEKCGLKHSFKHSEWIKVTQ